LRSGISRFVRGWEGIGLLLMRLACGGVLMEEAATRMSGIPASESFVYTALLAAAGLAMLTGYQTRIAGAGTAALEVSLLALGEGNAVVHSLLATLGTAVALMGPGAWSVDARLSGWRRIHIPRRRE
jgi:putative oxidoreductase